jgi:hypothetical protein
MNYLYLFILVIALLLVLVPIVLCRDNFSQSTQGIVYTNIGNILSDYFYAKYANNMNSIFPNTTPEIRDFLLKIQQHDTLPPYKFPSFTDDITPDKWIQRDRKNFLEFWKKARPYVRKVYDKTIPDNKKQINYPVIHFRCSDIPFNRHFMYHLPKIDTVNAIISILLERNISNVIWLNCNKHLSDTNTCNEINDFYIGIFEKNGIHVMKQCNSILDDFYLMIYCPLLVSLNSSSFSFMAGISKDPEDYISCNMGLEEMGEYKLQKDADWLMIKSEPLLHKDVNDYYNIEELMLKLQR